ncbi:hypothetical protein [Streptomyces sp. NPDC057363]|uniref:hypothetical protein n=1 Tax=Streptomyces sp. NPDC057363 TaxID=3346107 RepID=UPI0036370787
MATAEKQTKTITKTDVTLTLSLDEAEMVMSLTGMVVGNSETGPRKQTDAIYHALSRAGVTAGYKRHIEAGVIKMLDKPKFQPKPYSPGYYSF